MVTDIHDHINQRPARTRDVHKGVRARSILRAALNLLCFCLHDLVYLFRLPVGILSIAPEELHFWATCFPGIVLTVNWKGEIMVVPTNIKGKL